MPSVAESEEKYDIIEYDNVTFICPFSFRRENTNKQKEKDKEHSLREHHI